ncbi:MAG TPA: hypothetical protein VGK10_04075 [Prolixibacteraceae bacterium]|jgi:hypothetical protein
MKIFILLFAFFSFFFISSSVQALTSGNFEGEDQAISDPLRLKNKIIPLSNSVYKLLDYYEASGNIRFLPQAKPYTKVVILKLLDELLTGDQLSGKEKGIINQYIQDLTRASNGIQIYQQGTANGFALVGLGGETTVRAGAGKDATWTTSSKAIPYLSGDLGEHISFHASMGPAIERLAPDLFYQSYTKDQQVNFPYQSIGYAYLPYQFNYETLYTHAQISNRQAGQSNITKQMAVGFIYYTELNGSWLNGALQLSLNNQRRSWGHADNNMILSSTARRFPGIEMKIEPTHWLRYSYLTGSLFSYANQSTNYKKDIYGYDIGDLQNLFTLHLLEFTPTKWLQISATAGNIWSKRLEISYMMPFVFSHFSEVELGDYDNLSMGLDMAFRIPQLGKTWLSLFNDEFSFTKSGPLLRMPRNRYAWQLGLKTALLSHLLPGTTSTIKYTRVTPFVYTHYPDPRFNTFTARPLDMTYTHDGFNLGFYLPPNSGEFSWSLLNIAIPDLTLSLDNRLIIHGTNDLASTNVYQIYGDVYRDQLGEDIYKYPLLNFTKDGIYDWTILSDFKFDKKVREINIMGLNYFRVTGSLGVSRTWWKSNNSGVVAPSSRTMLSGSLGIVVDI